MRGDVLDRQVEAPTEAVSRRRRSGLVVRPVAGLVTTALFAALGVLYLPALGFLAIIVTLIVLHEAGHYAAARHAGMRPTEFFVGLGPVVFAWERNGCRYGLKAFLIGGYVKIPGMTPREEVAPALEPYTFRAASRRKRLVVILAGVTVNAAIGLGLFTLASLNDTLHQTRAADYTTASHETADVAMTGMSSTSDVAIGTLDGLKQLATGIGDYTGSITSGSEPPVRFLSPVGAAKVTAVAANNGLSWMLRFGAILSISLAVFNLLPLVPLDGGHAMVLIAEWSWSGITRRQHRFDANRLNPIAYGVIAFMLFLSATSLYLDLAHPVIR